jgi:hypothetical protein
MNNAEKVLEILRSNENEYLKFERIILALNLETKFNVEFWKREYNEEYKGTIKTLIERKEFRTLIQYHKYCEKLDLSQYKDFEIIFNADVSVKLKYYNNYR